MDECGERRECDSGEECNGQSLSETPLEGQKKNIGDNQDDGQDSSEQNEAVFGLKRERVDEEEDEQQLLAQPSGNNLCLIQNGFTKCLI